MIDIFSWHRNSWISSSFRWARRNFASLSVCSSTTEMLSAIPAVFFPFSPASKLRLWRGFGICLWSYPVTWTAQHWDVQDWDCSNEDLMVASFPLNNVDFKSQNSQNCFLPLSCVQALRLLAFNHLDATGVCLLAIHSHVISIFCCPKNAHFKTLGWFWKDDTLWGNRLNK